MPDAVKAMRLGAANFVQKPVDADELLIGDRGGRKRLLESLVLLPQARTVLHDEVVAFVRHHKLRGRGVGWIGIHLLASALVEELSLWTADPRLDALAEELGVSFRA